MQTQPHPQGIPTEPKTSGLAVASFIMAFLPLFNCIGFILGIVALVKIKNPINRLKGSGLAIGGLVISTVIWPVIFALAATLLPALGRAKSKANRVKCVNNVGNVYKAGLAFAQDNGERLPWQLTPTGVRNNIDPTITASSQYGRWLSPNINEVVAHPNSLAAAGVYGLNAMKAELVTPKILHSPCDAGRAMDNEIVQENWGSYDTKARGVSAELGAGSSYVLCRGADTRRPSAVYALTRNWSDDQLNTGEWLGSDSDPGNARTIAGLNASQGQCVLMDGSAKQSYNADFGGMGRLTKAAQTARGGVAKGSTSLNLIRGPGL
jgi:hypothetical protein